MNFPKRVPVFANPQDGSSMRNVSSAEKTFSLVDASMRTPFRNGRLQSYPRRGHGFLWQFCSFRTAKHVLPFIQATKRSQRETSVPTVIESITAYEVKDGPAISPCRIVLCLTQSGKR